MPNNEQRAARRIACEFPMRLLNNNQVVEALAHDISRKGVRIQVPGASLGVHRLSSLVQVARRVREVLGDTFVADMHHQLLGNLVQKRLRPIRIGHRDWVSPDVELGCRIDEGISDEEAGMLGLALPHLGVDEEPEELHAVAPVVREPMLSEAAQELQAPELVGDRLVLESALERTPGERRFFLEGREDGHRLPFRVELDGITEDGAVVRIPDVAELELDGEVSDVTRFVIAFDEAYGTVLKLRAVAGDGDLWHGPVQVRQVELPPNLDGQAVLSIAFEETLPEPLVADLSAA
ncbi:MAG: hypothetical protein QNJ98_04505 [Planctomycetota bacterium]|nr:hypothetical protein [Planctomycetota bacterium]